MKNYIQFKTSLLRNPRIRREYERLRPEFEVIALLLKMRLRKKLTQRELAQRVGTRQSAISRLESGTYNPSISLLYKIADALDARLKVSVSKK